MTKTSSQERLRGAIWGQFVGDAAGLGTQFINSSEDLRASFPKGIQGFETPQNVSPHAGKSQATSHTMEMPPSCYYNRL